MDFSSPLLPGILQRRYKRFLADVTLADGGEIVTAHVANSGSLMGLAVPGARVWLLDKGADAGGKLRYGLELIEADSGALVGVNTMRPNQLVAEALGAGLLPEFAAYTVFKKEQPYHASRFDFLLEGAGLPPCFIEVKSCTLSRDGWLEFPDAATARGAKHLGDLARAAGEGYRAVQLYLGQRDDCARFRLAADIDPTYAKAAAVAKAAGVEFMVKIASPTPEKLTFPTAALTLS
ncbi:MAG: DNA/RNA nuclease SfsA [Alphaproteobacteria bacterium]|nr:DNA/RNA nuclease SfsA [Alphaproteobacteria bacterium]